jgi:hypothetical protein
MVVEGRLTQNSEPLRCSLSGAGCSPTQKHNDLEPSRYLSHLHWVHSVGRMYQFFFLSGPVENGIELVGE